MLTSEDKEILMEQKEHKTIRWVKLTLTIIAFIAVSIGFGFLIQLLFTNFQIPLDVPVWIAMAIVFVVLLLVNLSLFIPLPFGVSIMLVAAAHWHPVLVALAGALGAGLGELSGYYFGYLGKRVAINEKTPSYQTVQRWIHKYGMWAIAFLSFQPVIPFEIGGFIAGMARMPVRKFLPATWIGKFPKYLILIYLGTSIFQFFFHRGF